MAKRATEPQERCWSKDRNRTTSSETNDNAAVPERPKRKAVIERRGKRATRESDSEDDSEGEEEEDAADDFGES